MSKFNPEKTIRDRQWQIFNRAFTEKRTMNPQELSEYDKLDREHAWLSQPKPDSRTAGREDTYIQRRPDDEHRALMGAFGSFLRGVPFTKDQAEAYHAQLQAIEQRILDLPPDQQLIERRALSADAGASVVATGTAGASTVAQGFVYSIDVALKYFGGILEAADYVDTVTGAPLPYPTMDDTANTGELTAENNVVSGANTIVGTDGGEVDPAFGVGAFGAFMIDSGFIRVPIQLLQDSAFNVEETLGEACTTRILRKLNTYCTTGTGNGQPSGIVGSATLGKTTGVGNTTSFTYNELLDLMYSVDRAYRNSPKCGWMMSDTAVKVARKLTDSNNRPLWIEGGTAEGIVNGEPPRLIGYPVYVNNDMAVPAASAKSVLFGDFGRFKIRRVRTMLVQTYRELFAAQLQIGVLAFQRFDSKLLQTSAVRYLQHGAS